MATSATRPDVGDILLVIHDFTARSSDELTLAKGDRVELVERDDEFGDGWFLGKHMVNGNSGLFPEVYTRPAPSNSNNAIKSAPSSAATPASQPQSQPQAPPAEPAQAPIQVQVQSPPQPEAPPAEPAQAASPPPDLKAESTPVTLPLSSYSAPNTATIPAKSPPVSAGIGSFSRLNQGQDNHVLHETLNVIDEHIDDLRSTPRHGSVSRHANDSGSEYSSNIDHRLSYIAGEETDEEEDGAHSRSEVESWTPDEVAEYLFTSGVEKHHCEVFRDQEITGEVLLGMDQTSLFIKAFDLGSVGRRLKTWQKVKALQDEVNGIFTRPTTQTYGSEAGSDVGRRTRSRNNTITSISRLPPIDDRPMSQQKRSGGPAPKLMPSGTFPLQESAHKKQPSFDRNWTLGGAAVTRPVSGSNFLSPENELQDSAVDLDRGYFSSAEGSSRNRNVLKKRDSTASHSRNTSYTEEQRKYYGAPAANGSHRRTLSTNTTESLRPAVPSKDSPPTVTKLDTASVDNLRPSPSLPVSPAHRQALANDLMQKPAKTSGVRAISDAVTGQERAKIAPALDSPLRDSPMQSPSRTGSSTLATVGSRGSKKKGKKDTSAYTRGLLKVTPREAMVDADYSGWMKKKSNGLMTTWKPRLFVLKGRRLAYYYSEDDEQEKGLIDISFHRVLPADNERLTGLHATLTGASNSPAVPVNSNVRTLAATEADADPTAASDSIFIFKLVPPRAGLSRAVNFTKPTVHYFAVPNIKQGRLWMAALMKATIDRDDNQPIVTSYQQKTISLTKARQMRHRPPALMNLDEKMEAGEDESPDPSKSIDGGGLGIYNGNGNGEDSAVAGLEKLGLSKVESVGSRRAFPFIGNGEVSPANLPQSA
ncbi:putative sam domain-containing protein [Diaporthe ampelina]|uniref:Putative sam domain-containing protein n=1 Tax=Diaporthe ampelina TaxID=1214573 RepID=A0A0G2FHP3_9PEZI|nr:putative sam domain-containing protein [Diaporthe ampelina]